MSTSIVPRRAALAALVAASALVPLGAAAQPTSPAPVATLAPASIAKWTRQRRTFCASATRSSSRAATGNAHYSLEAVRPSDMNMGSIAGTLVGSHVATAIDSGAKCKLYVTASDAGLTISQDLKFGDCGFGYGVFASGIYKRTSR